MAAFTTQHLLPGISDHIELGPRHRHREHRARGIGNAEASAIIGDPVTVRDPDARRGAIPGKHNVGCPIDRSQIGQFAVRGGDHFGIDLQLLHHVGDPAFTKTLPSQHRRRTFAEHRPQSHFDSTGVGGRDNGDAVAVRDTQNLAGQVDRQFQARLPELGAVRPAKHFGIEVCGRPARTLCAGA